MESPPGWLPRRNQASAKLAFRQTIQTFDHYIHDLVHSGNQTSECMGTLDNHVHAAKHLLDEAKRLTNQQIDHLRGIWSCLGGNRSLLADARARLKVITAARVQTQTIHEMIWDAQAHLKQLQTSCHSLRPFASAGDSSREAMHQVVHGLSSGCRDIQNKMFRAHSY